MFDIGIFVIKICTTKHSRSVGWPPINCNCKATSDIRISLVTSIFKMENMVKNVNADWSMSGWSQRRGNCALVSLPHLATLATSSIFFLNWSIRNEYEWRETIEALYPLIEHYLPYPPPLMFKFFTLDKSNNFSSNSNYHQAISRILHPTLQGTFSYEQSAYTPGVEKRDPIQYGFFRQELKMVTDIYLWRNPLSIPFSATLSQGVSVPHLTCNLTYLANEMHAYVSED